MNRFAQKIKQNFILTRTFIKHKNCSKLDQKSSKIGFVTPKIVVYCNKLTKIILLYVNRKMILKQFYKLKQRRGCATPLLDIKCQNYSAT